MVEAGNLADTSSDLLTQALAAHNAGLCILPPKQDGSKQPDVTSWTPYQHRRSTPEEIERWYADGDRTGLGIVCGAVSGQVELFEFDDAEIHTRFLAAAQDAELAELVDRIAGEWSDATPGDGVHWYYRLRDAEAKTTALARRHATDAAGRSRLLPLIETKGEGGYVITAPSHGTVHPSGRPYRRLAGGPTTIVTITAAERDALWSLARRFDEVPKPELTSTRPGRSSGDDRWLVRPGDDYNERASWEEILAPHGWQPVRHQGEETLWCRPDGYPGGWGASTNHQGSDRLYVWTTATPFDPDRSYAKFAAYTVLEHGGDFAAAARSLDAAGYGERSPTVTPSSPSRPLPLIPVPPFPLDALPPIARIFVAAGAEALGCPPDFVALPLFAFCGAVAGNARKLRLKPGFEVSPIFWTGVVGKPGTVKTPALNHARRPLDALQKEAWEHYTTALTQWEEERPVERGTRPRPEHYFATDTTTEAIAFALMSSRGLAVIHDELAGWVKAFDAYRKAGDRQTWLSAWSGSPLKPNRKTGEPIFVPDPVVCVAGGIQPEVLADLAGEAARDDGFIPRLLLAWPDADPSPWTDEVVDETVVERMLTIVRSLRLSGEETIVTTLTDAAYAEWVGWFNENRTITGGSRGLAAGWAAKAPVHLARIALVLHLLAAPTQHDQPLDGDTLRDAIAILEYVRAHLGRILPAFGATAPEGSAVLSARILSILIRVFPEGIGRAELAVKLGGHEASEAVGTALLILAARAQAHSRIVSSGGRPREEWRAVGIDEELQRDKGKDVESPPNADFSRFHVITHEPEPEPDIAWEHWEEPL